MLGQRNLLRKTCGSTAGAGVGQRLVVSRAYKRNKQQQQQQQNRTGYADPGLYNLPPIDPNGAPPLPPQQQQPAAAPQQQQAPRPAGAPQQQGWAASPPPPSQPGWGPNPAQIPASQPGWSNTNPQQQAGFVNTSPPAAAPYAAPQAAPAQNPAGPGAQQNPAAANPGFGAPQGAPQHGQQQQQQQQGAAAGNGYGNYGGGWQTPPPQQQQQQQGGYVNPNQQLGGFNPEQGGYFTPNQQGGGYINPPNQQGGYINQPNQQQQPGFVQQQGGYGNPNPQQGGYINQPNQQQQGGYMNTQPNQQQQGGYINPPNQQQRGFQQPRQQNSWTDLGGFVDQGGYMDNGGYMDAGRNPNDMGGFTNPPPPQRTGWNQGGSGTGYYRNNRQQQQNQAFLDQGGYMNDTATGWAPLQQQGQQQRRAGFTGFDPAGSWTEDYLLQQLDNQMPYNKNNNMQMDAWQEEVEVEEDLTPKYVNGNRVLVNSEIEAPKVRVQDATKADIGVMTFEKARELSIKQDCDVVLINKEGDPPVVRLISFSKYKYELEKATKQKQKASKGPEIKEVKLRPVTEKADYDTKVKQAQKFLSKGAKVKLTMTFSGREMRFKDQGKEMMLQLIEELSTTSKMEAPLALRPSNFSVTLVPLK